ncbi:transposase [bacterium]|nr:transposase [bacterium]
MVSKTSSLIKFLRLLDEVYEEEQEQKGRGRPKVYSHLTILKVFVVMILKKIKSFKGLHRYLEQNPTVRKYCRLKSVPDRITLGRRLKVISPSGKGTN